MKALQAWINSLFQAGVQAGAGPTAGVPPPFPGGGIPGGGFPGGGGSAGGGVGGGWGGGGGGMSKR